LQHGPEAVIAGPARDPDSFRAVLAAEPDGPSGRLVRLAREQLPEEAVTVRVAYSSLNYKDGLALTGRGRVVRKFPMVCGVDLAGEVEQSDDPGFSAGDQVIATGFGLGEDHWGGLSELARVRPEWLVRVPDGRDPRWAMSVGTAGLTAMLCVLALERHDITPEGAGGLPVVVTGAAGGVGSVAVALLAELGYRVVAVSGRSEHEAYLRRLGAAEVLTRSELADAPVRALDRQRWSGAVDAVGGTTLATVIRQTRYGGCVAACGLAGGADLATTVYPFILRGVTLAGVESVQTPLPLRERAWERLSAGLPPALLEEMTVVEPLGRVPELGEEILAGRTRGRLVIDVGS
jgi:acrylyl-CoA reductase (NADPH)